MFSLVYLRYVPVMLLSVLLLYSRLLGTKLEISLSDLR